MTFSPLAQAVPREPLNPGGQVQSAWWLTTLHSDESSQGFSMEQGSSQRLLMQARSGGQSASARQSTDEQVTYGSPSRPTGQVQTALWAMPVHSALPPQGRWFGPQTGVHSPPRQA